MDQPHSNEPNSLHLVLFILGGLCTGIGILSLYWSFGWEAGTFNSDFAYIGASAMDNISLLEPATFAITSLVVGVSLLVIGNISAWQQTDGY